MNLFEKPFNLSDKIEGNKPVTFFKGHVVVVDDISGETILEKDNLVVLRGRTFALEKMFAIDNNIDGYNKTNLANKKICLWKVGRGGCVSGEPFNVLAVEPNARALGDEIPFRVHENGTKPDEFKGVYYNPVQSEVVDASGKNYTYYYAKSFDKMEWVKNTNEYGQMDEIALKLTLKITEDDFRTVLKYDENDNPMWERDTFINEIALCIANYNEAADRMDNIEIATKLTFESEPYFNNLKEATIYYYVYA